MLYSVRGMQEVDYVEKNQVWIRIFNPWRMREGYDTWSVIFDLSFVPSLSLSLGNDM